MPSKRKSLWERIDMKFKVMGSIVGSILVVSGAGWTAANTLATQSDVSKVETLAQVASGKADYLLTQQIESVKDKQKVLRQKHRFAPAQEKRSIEIDLEYWRGEQQRLESIQKGK